MIGTLWRQHRRALIGFTLAAVVTLFFLVRITVSAVYWANPAHHNMTPEPWMTIGYVGQSWGLDPAEIDTRAGFPAPHKGVGHPMTLIEIARQRGKPVAQVITELEAVILTMKAQGPQK
jgi:hypothetical protein